MLVSRWKILFLKLKCTCMMNYWNSVKSDYLCTMFKKKFPRAALRPSEIGSPPPSRSLFFFACWQPWSGFTLFKYNWTSIATEVFAAGSQLELFEPQKTCPQLDLLGLDSGSTLFALIRCLPSFFCFLLVNFLNIINTVNFK